MLRPAVAADLRRLLAIRDASGDAALSDPALVSEAALRRLIAAGSVTAADLDGGVAGFAAVDGAAIHLLVDDAARGRSVGRDLLAAACAAIAAAGHATATLTLATGGAAERHYRAAGWIAAEKAAAGGLALKKPL